MATMEEVAVAFSVDADGVVRLHQHGAINDVFSYVAHTEAVYAKELAVIGRSFYCITSYDCNIDVLNRLVNDPEYFTETLNDVLGGRVK